MEIPLPGAAVTIRPAVPGDVPRVRALEVAWEAEGISIAFQAADEAWIARFVGRCFFVAEEAGALAGFIRGRVGDDEWNAGVVPHGERYLEIEDLYVVPGRRSHGVGARLVEAACGWARAQGGGVRDPLLVDGRPGPGDPVLPLRRVPDLGGADGAAAGVSRGGGANRPGEPGSAPPPAVPHPHVCLRNSWRRSSL